MTKLNEIYKCELCGHIVEVANEGAPTLACCGQNMVKLEAKTADEGKEKHVPVIEETPDGLIIKVGSVAHPMEEDHYIKFIEIIKNDKVIRAELKPGQFAASLKSLRHRFYGILKIFAIAQISSGWLKLKSNEAKVFTCIARIER